MGRAGVGLPDCSIQKLELIKMKVRIGEQDVFLAFAAGHDLAVIPSSPWGCCSLVGIGKGLFWKKIEL